MDGLEFQRFIVDIFNLDQGVSGRMIHAHDEICFFPNRFGGCEGVVAVSHRVQQDRGVMGSHPYFWREKPRLGEVPQSGDHAILQGQTGLPVYPARCPLPSIRSKS